MKLASVEGQSGVLTVEHVAWMVGNTAQVLVAHPWYSGKIVFDGRGNAHYSDLLNLGGSELIGVNIAAMGLLFSPDDYSNWLMLYNEITNVESFYPSSGGNQSFFEILVSLIRPLGYLPENVVLSP